MAGPCAWRSPHQNPPPAAEDELTKAASGAPINDSDTPSHTPAMSYITTPALAPPFAYA